MENRNLTSLQGGSYGAGGEILDWTYYDSFAVSASTLVQRLFTQSLGQGSTPKTLDITNMTNGGSIPQGQRLDVRAIKLFLTSKTALATAAVQKLYTFLSSTTVELIMPGKDSMGTWTLQELLGTCSLLAFTPTVSGDNIPVIEPRFHGIFPLNTVWTLAALTPFEIRVTHQAAPDSSLADLKVQIGLNGRLTRLS